MKNLTRRSCLAMGFAGLPVLPLQAQLSPDKKESAAAQRRPLPKATIFKGESRFQSIVEKAQKENWRKLAIGERVIRCAREMHGVPYENFTLEIDDKIESPSVNFNGLDCWTFFETSLGLARMLAFEKTQYSPEDLLRQIQVTRYRGGQCSGQYLERIHYLAEWFFENDARGTCRHITPDLSGAARITNRKVTEMTTLWKGYRYLKNTPSLLAPMRKWEQRVEAMPVYHIPKDKVAAIEPELRNGDVIGIATKYHGGFCSHVGLAIRTEDKVTRFMHASRDYRKVVIDKSISGYLAQYSKHAGIIVGRPLEASQTITDEEQYQTNLKKLIG